MEAAAIAVALAAVGLGWWRIDVNRRPFAPCRRCGGSGRNRGSRESAYGVCPHGGERVRWTAAKAAARHKARRK